MRAFTSPREALAAVEAEDFDAVVTDLAMQELDGIALCKAVLERKPQLPVLVLSGHGSFDSAVAAACSTAAGNRGRNDVLHISGSTQIRAPRPAASSRPCSTAATLASTSPRLTSNWTHAAITWQSASLV